MTISIEAVGEAVTARLNAAVEPPGRYATAPAGSPTLYFVVERPPGTQRTGSLGDPESDLEYRVRVRAVAVAADAQIAARAAEHLDSELAAALLDRTVEITGDGWSVSGRSSLSDGGTDVQGQVANTVSDYTLLISA